MRRAVCSNCWATSSPWECSVGSSANKRTSSCRNGRAGEGSSLIVTITDTKITGLGSDKILNIECFEICGDSKNNLLDASAYTLGSVMLCGMGGNDTLRTGAGRDLALGEGGDDRIESRSEDIISGGPGTDTFVGAHAKIDEVFFFDFDKLLI